MIDFCHFMCSHSFTCSIKTNIMNYVTVPYFMLGDFIKILRHIKNWYQ